MAKKRRRRRRSPLPAIIMVLVVLLIAGAAVFIFSRHSETFEPMDKMSYYSLHADDEAAIIIDDKLLDDKGFIQNGTIYLDYSLVYNYLNQSFYQEADGQILLTMPEGNQSWSPEDGSGAVITKDGVTYLSADIVKEFSDIDMTILSDPGRVVARTKWVNLAAETVKVDTVVRFRGGPKSEVLTEVKAGDIVVLTSNADDWAQVSTQDGYIGYILRKNIEAAPEGSITHSHDSRFDFSKQLEDYKINLAWQFTQYDDGAAEFPSLVNNATGLNTISPTWFTFADGSGNLNSLASAEYVDQAHNWGMKVWGCLQDVYGDVVNVGSVLADQESRTNVIDQLMQICRETGMDGINVDIETISSDNVAQYLQFLRELSVAAHKEGYVVSVDNYVPLYTSYLNRSEQARYVDYLVIMGYDEHTVSSDTAGSVASLPFVEQGIKDTLAEASASQVINAIPFYTRGWTTTTGADQPSSEALGMYDAESWASYHGINLTWDPTIGQMTGSAQSDDQTYSIWLENEKSIEEKMKLVQKYDLAGVAEWRLGFERADVWEIIGRYLK